MVVLGFLQDLRTEYLFPEIFRVVGTVYWRTRAGGAGVQFGGTSWAVHNKLFFVLRRTACGGRGTTKTWYSPPVPGPLTKAGERCRENPRPQRTLEYCLAFLTPTQETTSFEVCVPKVFPMRLDRATVVGYLSTQYFVQPGTPTRTSFSSNRLHRRRTLWSMQKQKEIVPRQAFLGFQHIRCGGGKPCLSPFQVLFYCTRSDRRGSQDVFCDGGMTSKKKYQVKRFREGTHSWNRLSTM